jgi:dipeptidyl aminopeptidase/acylaminoacyl peptidase
MANCISIEKMLSLPDYQSVRISPDGKKVAFVEVRPNWKENKYIKRVWIYDSESGRKFPVTSPLKSSFSPAWSKDSKALAFISEEDTKEKEKKNQIYIKFDFFNPALKITDAPEGIDSFKWSPDDQGIYYVSTPKNEGIEKRNKEYGEFEFVDEEYSRNALYYCSIDAAIEKINGYFKTDYQETSEKNKEIFKSEKLHIDNFLITEKGDILLALLPSPNMEERDEKKLYLLTREGKLRETGIDQIQEMMISENSDFLAITREKENSKWFLNNYLEVINLKTWETTNINTDIDENIFLVGWYKDFIYFQWQDRTKFKTFRVNLKGKVEAVSASDENILECSIAIENGVNASIKSTKDTPTDIYFKNIRITEKKEITNDYSLPMKSIIKWKSSDDIEIEGILSVPENFDTTKKYPLLIIVHGGPTWASFDYPLNNKIYPIEEFVSKGFIVLQPNYRGSSGYGEKFRKLNFRYLGLGDYDDVISGVDFLISEGFVNSEKVGIMGWSQGGYISAFVSTFSNRFKAISVGAGISDWISYYYATDIHQFTRYYLDSTPWEDKEIYRITSPMTYIKKACTPVLIQHGEIDNRVPVNNAYKLYQGLRDMNIPVKFVLYKGMKHSPDKPGFFRAIANQNLEWFCKYLKNTDA